MKRIIFSTFLVIVLTLMVGNFNQLTAQEKNPWPTKQVTIVVPTNPGGTVDRLSRGVAPFLAKELKVTVTIENRPGGNSVVGTVAHLKNDPHDGSFWLLSSTPMFEANTLRGAPYKIEDFDYIAALHSDPLAIFVRKDSPYQTLKELLDAIKNNPGKLKYADVPGSWGQVVMKIIEDEILDSTTVRIPFTKGGARPRTMLIGGHVDFVPLPYKGTIAAIGGETKCLGISKREPYAQEVPLIAEVTKKYKQGVTFPEPIFMRHFDIKKSFKASFPDRWMRMAEALKAVFNDPEFQKWNKKSKMGLSLTNPADSEILVHEQMKLVSKYADVFK
jgi:tripartite-type tricarboxylate transporter receptor subunit TctC